MASASSHHNLGLGIIPLFLSLWHTVQITTAGAGEFQEAEEALPAFFAVAGLNAPLWSLPRMQTAAAG
jgi:hypothetical protein